MNGVELLTWLKTNKNSAETDNISNNLADFDLAYIRNHMLVCNDSNASSTAKYTGVDFGEVPISMFFDVIFEEGDQYPNVTLIVNPNGVHDVMDIGTKSLHIGFTNVNISISTFTDDVITNHYTYSFDEAIPLDNETITRMGFEISGEDIILTGPSSYKSNTFTLSGLSAFLGNYCTFEHYYTGLGKGRPQFDYIEINGSTLPALKDNFKRNNGAIGVSPTGHTYVQLTNIVTL